MQWLIPLFAVLTFRRFSHHVSLHSESECAFIVCYHVRCPHINKILYLSKQEHKLHSEFAGWYTAYLYSLCYMICNDPGPLHLERLKHVADLVSQMMVTMKDWFIWVLQFPGSNSSIDATKCSTCSCGHDHGHVFITPFRYPWLDCHSLPKSTKWSTNMC